jgi:hypothetical protein
MVEPAIGTNSTCHRVLPVDSMSTIVVAVGMLMRGLPLHLLDNQATAVEKRRKTSETQKMRKQKKKNRSRILQPRQKLSQAFSPTSCRGGEQSDHLELNYPVTVDPRLYGTRNGISGSMWMLMMTRMKRFLPRPLMLS